MTTSLAKLPVSGPSSHGVGLLDPANAQTDFASISNLELADSGISASDDEVATPPVWPALVTPIGPVAPLRGSAAAAIPGIGGDPPLEVTTAGSGLVFFDSFTPNDTQAYENCVVAAEKQLEGIFTNNVTLRMSFDMENVKGGDTDGNNTTGGQDNYSYATLKAAMLKLAPDDIFPAVDPSGGKGFTIPEAYARMLGLSSAAPSIDATVTFDSFSSGQPWNFGQDVVNAITHGISEAGMGRDSGLGKFNGDIWTPLDLFRYTGPGGYDSSDGPEPTFFSSDGGRQTSASAGLSFNNQDTGGDPDDWQQQAVFGDNNAGETLSLSPTELDMMSALGWTVKLKQQVFTAPSGDWENPSNWENGYNPIAAEDAALGNGVAATLSSAAVTVNSITLGASSTLIVENGGSLTATNGTSVNSADADVIFASNDGTIEVGVGASMSLSGDVLNLGTISLGAQVTNTGDIGVLTLNGATTFDGGGAIDMGGIAVSFSADIVKGGGGGGGGGPPVTTVSFGLIDGPGALVNVDNNISGAGQIIVNSLDNRSIASIGANMAGYTLQIESGAISNEGELFADAQTTLEIGLDGAAALLRGAGRIDLAAGADLAISGNLTDAGAGTIHFNGAGGALTSDGVGPTTFDNGYAIVATASAQIGDAGVKAANDLSLIDTGSILAENSGVTLTLNTGANNIIDRGGLFEAESGAQLTIDSAIQTGQFVAPGVTQPPQSTIEAGSGGVVNIAASIYDGVKFSTQINGQILIDGGTVNVAAGVFLGVPVTFAGSGGVLNLADTPSDVDVFGASGAINLSHANADVTGGGFTVTETGTDWLAIGGNGVNGAADIVHGSGLTTTTHASSNVSIVGSEDTVNVGVANALSLDGANDVLNLHQLFGDTTLSGFAASDVMEISNSDFADFQALLSHTTQSGANTLIALDANDVIKLTNVEASSLTASQFKFV